MKQELPTWTDCELAVDEGRATALQKFIYEYEPGDNDKEWRERLSAAIQAAANSVQKDQPTP